jgi:hypothetical protein
VNEERAKEVWEPRAITGPSKLEAKIEVKQTWQTRILAALMFAIFLIVLVAVLAKTCEVAWAWIS